MGCTIGYSIQEAEGRVRPWEIEKLLKEEESGLAREIKLLLLGIGGSGKTTIVKQLRLIHERGFNHYDYKQYKPVIYSNVIHSLMAIVEAMPGLGINFENNERKLDQEIVSEVIYRRFDEEQYSDGVLGAMKRLWNDKGVKECYGKSRHYQLSDNIDHFLNDLDRLAVSNYRPSTEDILLTRIKTTGIVQIPMLFNDINFRIFDVGGQRAERKKWINCFDNNVSAIIYCTAISEYDQTLSEDEKTAQMTSLKLQSILKRVLSSLVNLDGNGSTLI